MCAGPIHMNTKNIIHISSDVHKESIAVALAVVALNLRAEPPKTQPATIELFNGKDLTGRSPLLAGAAIGNTEAMRLLIAKGARVNASTAKRPMILP